MNRDCPKCKDKMIVDLEKYCDVTVWRCPDCGHEIYICDNCC